jgi:decaprenylphospho-beta-D-ribofuranose 2-oxidase
LAEPTLLTGWGRTAPSAAVLVPAATDADVKTALTSPPPRGVLARGLGRAYGDAAQNGGGVVLDMTAGEPLVSLDPATGLVTATGGTSLEHVIRTSLPQGWFVPVTPGTRYVTVGGAVAGDIHGKNHHVDGSWMRHVRSLTLGLPGGEERVVGPDQDADVFWATAGGMGLTGVVTSCTFRATAVETSRMMVDTTRLPDLDAVLAAMLDADARYRYSVAWVDVLARGGSLGRSVLTAGDHAPLSALDSAIDADEARAFDPKTRVSVPPVVPNGVLNRLSLRAFNELWFRKTPARRTGELQTITQFFHPLDMVREWNRIYGRRGFVQWQCVLPDGSEGDLRTVLERLGAARAASFVTVLKRFGPGDPGPLSFPAPGWTLAVDIAATVPGLAVLLDGLDRVVADAGGRIYLAKDSRMAPELLPVMYPRLDEWRAIRDGLDPEGTLQSDLGRRLGLCIRKEPRS